MRIKSNISLLLLVISMTGCREEALITNPEQQPQDPVASSYAIPVDSALAYLDAFMDELDTDGTRGMDKRIVRDITPIKFTATLTRAAGTSAGCDNLLYIANFENEQGYALLAADTRIGSPVLAITDQGSLSDATVYAAMELANGNRPVFKDYPLEGDAFFTTPQTGDEVFMNPNTVSLYFPDKDDVLVGNFSTEEERVEFPNSSYLESPQGGNQLVTSALCVGYSTQQIKQNSKDPQPFLSDFSNTQVDPSAPKIHTSYTPWTVTAQREPILTTYVRWSQGSPFNDHCPERQKYLVLGQRKRASAGCFPLAIAKVLSRLDSPQIKKSIKSEVDWYELQTQTNPLYYSDRGKNSAANLLAEIGEGCDSWYFYAGTFTFPNNATSYMRSIGLPGAHSYPYKFSRVQSMINAGKPLIIYSVPLANIFACHCWNIDGYKIKQRQVRTKSYDVDGKLLEDKKETEIYEMVHCDFGWRGNCNGYYISGIFNLNDSRVEFDGGHSTEADYNFNFFTHVVTY